MTDQPTTAEPARARLSPRKKQRISRGIQYAVLVAALVGFVFYADWPSLAQNFAKPDVAARCPARPVHGRAAEHDHLHGRRLRPVGFVFGLLLALMRLSTVRPYRWIASIYIEIFRGLPALLIFLLHHLPAAGAARLRGARSAPTAQGILGLGLVGAAYQAEIFRAGLQAVPQGQIEAARSLGMSAARSHVTVVIPQAIRIVIPPTTNQFVALLKDSSLVLFLGVSGQYVELAKFGNDLASQYANATPIMVAGITYLIVTIPLGYLAGRLEKLKGTGR